MLSRVTLTFLSVLWVRLTFGQMYPPLVRLQVRLISLTDLHVRLTFSQLYPIGVASVQVNIFDRSSCQADFQSAVPPLVWIQVKSTFVSDFWVRLTFGQMYCLTETSCGQVYYYFSKVDLWSDVSPIGEASGQVDIFV